MTFSQKPTAIIWAKDSDGIYHSVNGISPDNFSDNTAVTQLNKIFSIVGKTIIPDGMQRIKTEEATNNG